MRASTSRCTAAASSRRRRCEKRAWEGATPGTVAGTMFPSQLQPPRQRQREATTATCKNGGGRGSAQPPAADRLDAGVSRRYRDTVLTHGGEIAPEELVRRFLGRPATAILLPQPRDRNERLRRPTMSTPVQKLFDLSGQTALVTGGSARPRPPTDCRALGEAGAKIFLSTSRKAADLETTAPAGQGHRRTLGGGRRKPAEVERVATRRCSAWRHRHPRQQRQRHLGAPAKRLPAGSLGQGDEPEHPQHLPSWQPASATPA